MNAIKKTYDEIPETINVPKEFINKKGEIIILIENEKTSAWPDNFFKETYGFMKSEKISRGTQGDISERNSIK